MAYKSGLQFAGREIHFDLKIEKGLFEDDNTYHKYFGSQCQMCGSRLICNGCSQCGQCKKPS